MSELARAHDAAAQMIDTSIIRVNQHGGGIRDHLLKAAVLCDIRHRALAGYPYTSRSRRGSPGDVRRLTMRELSTNELDTVIGGSVVSYPGVYLQETSGSVTSIPGVSTSTGQQTYVAAARKAPFHWH